MITWERAFSGRSRALPIVPPPPGRFRCRVSGRRCRGEGATQVAASWWRETQHKGLGSKSGSIKTHEEHIRKWTLRGRPMSGFTPSPPLHGFIHLAPRGPGLVGRQAGGSREHSLRWRMTEQVGAQSYFSTCFRTPQWCRCWRGATKPEQSWMKTLGPKRERFWQQKAILRLWLSSWRSTDLYDLLLRTLKLKWLWLNYNTVLVHCSCAVQNQWTWFLEKRPPRFLAIQLRDFGIFKKKKNCFNMSRATSLPMTQPVHAVAHLIWAKIETVIKKKQNTFIDLMKSRGEIKVFAFVMLIISQPNAPCVSHNCVILPTRRGEAARKHLRSSSHCHLEPRSRESYRLGRSKEIILSSQRQDNHNFQ